MPFFQHKRFAVLVSLSRDGELMTKIANNLRNSDRQRLLIARAARGLLAAIKKVKEGFNFAIAVDGPRGPIFKVKEGLPAISKKSQVPILPARAYPKTAKIFRKSWNQGQASASLSLRSILNLPKPAFTALMSLKLSYSSFSEY